MDINSIPDIFQSKIRIAIVSSLLTGPKTFKEIKHHTGASDGNISTHMKKLNDADYVKIVKDYEDNKPRTTYSLTNTGRNDFKNYVKVLENILKNTGAL